MKAIVVTYEEPESSHSFEIATFDEAEYPLMDVMFAEIVKHEQPYPGPYFSIRDYTPPPHNPQKLEDFFKPPQKATPFQFVVEDWTGPLAARKEPLGKQLRTPKPLSPDFGTDPL